jgi:hypothetical protein
MGGLCHVWFCAAIPWSDAFGLGTCSSLPFTDSRWNVFNSTVSPCGLTKKYVFVVRHDVEASKSVSFYVSTPSDKWHLNFFPRKIYSRAINFNFSKPSMKLVFHRLSSVRKTFEKGYFRVDERKEIIEKNLWYRSISNTCATPVLIRIHRI